MLKPGGTARIMIYHKWSIVGLMLWLRYGRLSSSLASIYANHLESPGTKAYSTREAAAIVEASGLRVAKMEVELSPGDLLSGATGQRHRGVCCRSPGAFGRERSCLPLRASSASIS